MIREMKVAVRLTKEDLDYIEDRCNTYGISRSEFIRRAVRGYGNLDIKYMAQKLYDLQSVVNKMNSVGVTDDEINVFIKDVNELWQYLK